MWRDVGQVAAVVAAALAVLWAVMAPSPVVVPEFPSVPPASPTAEFRHRPLPHTTPWGPRLTDDPGIELDSP